MFNRATSAWSIARSLTPRESMMPFRRVTSSSSSCLPPKSRWRCSGPPGTGATACGGGGGVGAAAGVG